MGTGILPAHLPFNGDHIPAKDTIHYPFSSYPNGAKRLNRVLFVPGEMAVCYGFHGASSCYPLFGCSSSLFLFLATKCPASHLPIVCGYGLFLKDDKSSF